MTSRDNAALLRAAVAAVRGCADTMETRAAGLLQAVPTLSDVVPDLEQAAERDERYKPAFVVVIEATGLIL